MSDWAKREKAALAAVSTETEYKEVTTGSGGGTVAFFYNFTPPKKEGNKQLVSGDVIEGTYLGSPISKAYNNPFHKIETTEGIIALPSASDLNRKIAKLQPGTKVKVVYNGMEKMTGGKNPGKKTHVFKVFSN